MSSFLQRLQNGTEIDQEIQNMRMYVWFHNAYLVSSGIDVATTVNNVILYKNNVSDINFLIHFFISIKFTRFTKFI